MNAAFEDLRAAGWLRRLAGSRAGAGLPLFYAAWALPFLVLLAWVTPPWQNPDEPLHFARAVHVAHGGLLGWRQYGTTGGVSDRAIYTAWFPVQHAAMQPAQRLSRADLARSQAVKWSAPLYSSFPNTAQYPPFFYLPDALSYWAARAAHLHIDRALLLARLLNALCFTALATLALALARRTRLLLLVILMLPTTLSLACSASQDSLAEGCAALAVALLDRAALGAPWGPRWLPAVLLALIAMARPPYVGFLAVLGLGGGLAGRARLQAGLAAAGVAAWCLLVALHTSVPFSHASPRAQLALLAAHPLNALIIPARTVWQFGLDWWVQLIGVLGWTDTYLPGPYIAAASLVLALAAAAAPGPAPAGAWRAWAGCAFAGAAILVLQFLTWTWPGQDVVTGVLGRYFTMPAMVLGLGLPSLGRAGHWARRAAPACVLGLALVTPAVVIHAVVFRYYVN